MHLTECFAPLFAYLGHFQHSARENLQGVDELRRQIDRLLKEGEEAAARGGIPRESYDLARFAVCAWSDEAILNSPWPGRDAWLKEELQRRHYGTSDAGEEFFDRLKDLPLNECEVREIFYLCLALGFTGRYCGAGGDEALEKLKSAEQKVLLGGCALEPDEEGDLFPGGYPRDLPAGGKKTARFSFESLPPVSTVTLPVIGFVILLAIFRFALTGMADNLLRSVPF